MNLRRAFSIEDLRGLARKRAPRFVFDYVDGGAEDGATLRRNRAALERVRFRPRTLVDVSRRRLDVAIFGKPAAMPAVVGPMGLLGLSWRRGDLEMARAAARAGIPYCVSTTSMDSLEDIARGPGPCLVPVLRLP